MFNIKTEHLAPFPFELVSAYAIPLRNAESRDPRVYQFADINAYKLNGQVVH